MPVVGPAARHHLHLVSAFGIAVRSRRCAADGHFFHHVRPRKDRIEEAIAGFVGVVLDVDSIERDVHRRLRQPVNRRAARDPWGRAAWLGHDQLGEVSTGKGQWVGGASLPGSSRRAGGYCPKPRRRRVDVASHCRRRRARSRKTRPATTRRRPGCGSPTTAHIGLQSHVQGPLDRRIPESRAHGPGGSEPSRERRILPQTSSQTELWNFDNSNSFARVDRLLSLAFVHCLFELRDRFGKLALLLQ
jgi:hypothetical protein